MISFAGQTVTDEANQNLRAGVVELVLMNGTDSSQQRNELQVKLRTENITTISNPMIPLVAESVLDDGQGNQSEQDWTNLSIHWFRSSTA